MHQKFCLTPFKEYPSSLKTGLIYFLSLLGCYLLILLCGNDIVIKIPVNVQEMGDVGVGYSFTFQLQSVIKIFLLSMVHGTLSYFLFKKLLLKYQESQRDLKTPISPVKSHILEMILLWTIVTLMMGHVIHWLFDRANFLSRAGTDEYPTDESFMLVYFADEYLSHAIIHVSYFILLAFGAYCEFGIHPHRQMHRDEIVVMLGLVVGVIIINGEAARVGESGLILMILSILAIIVIIILKVWKKFAVLEYPLLCTLFIGSIGVGAYYIYMIIVGNTLSYYPYIT